MQAQTRGTEKDTGTDMNTCTDVQRDTGTEMGRQGHSCGAPLTSIGVGEPGGEGVEVDGVEAHGAGGRGAAAEPNADAGVFLARRHQHLEDRQRTGQREVKVLQGRRGGRIRGV